MCYREPSASDVGTQMFSLKAIDTTGHEVTTTYLITILNTNDAPTVANTIADQSTAEDTSFSYQVPSNTFTDVDTGDTLTYTSTLSNGSSLPPGSL